MSTFAHPQGVRRRPRGLSPLMALLATLLFAPSGLLAAPGGWHGGGQAPAQMNSPGGRSGHGSGQGPGPAPNYGGGNGHYPGHGSGHGSGYAPGRWWDGAHGHGHYYPSVGWGVPYLPAYAATLAWAGINYGYYGGVWYQPGAYGYVVVRPPLGIVVGSLPTYRTVVMADGLGYYYANGSYYRERAEGGYEVVAAPAHAATVAAAAPAARVFVYPREAQSAERQSSDEYDCHRWAVTQSSFDPSAQATGHANAGPGGRDDYQRARTACLEGRGYTVR